MRSSICLFESKTKSTTTKLVFWEKSDRCVHLDFLWHLASFAWHACVCNSERPREGTCHLIVSQITYIRSSIASHISGVGNCSALKISVCDRVLGNMLISALMQVVRGMAIRLQVDGIPPGIPPGVPALGGMVEEL